MEAIVWDSEKAELKYYDNKELPLQLAHDDVLIRVAFAGICGTDMHIIHGSFESAPRLILGHEITGIVEETGQLMTKTFKKGARVYVSPNPTCKQCIHCQAGRINLCSNRRKLGSVGIDRDGGWATYVRVKGELVFELPHGMVLEHAVLCEPVSCVVRGLRRIGYMVSGSRVLIMGAGVIGLLWALILHFKGFRKIVISEVSEKRRKIVESLHIDCKLGDPNSDTLEAETFDVIIDSTGSVRALNEAVLLASKGGVICVFGVAAKEEMSELSLWDIVSKELRIVGARMSPFTEKETTELVAEMSSAGYFDFTKMGISKMPLKEVHTAVEMLKEQSVSKIVFDLKCGAF